MDVLSDVLQVVRLKGSIFFTADLYGKWSFASPEARLLFSKMSVQPKNVALFHIITDGESWFETEDGNSVLMDKGSVIIFPHGCAHKMCSDKNMNPVSVLDILDLEELDQIQRVHHGNAGEKTEFICGYLFCEHEFSPLIGALPDKLILSPKIADGNSKSAEVLPLASDGWLGNSLNRLIEEVKSKSPGGRTLVTRLTELLFFEVLRTYMKHLPGKSKGWLAGVQDVEVGLALKLLHNEPARKWSVESLASEIGISRSALAKRFTDLVGEPPMKYLTQWRIQLSKRLLQDATLSTAIVAEKVGYGSDVAFNRAFSRCEGISPGKWKSRRVETAL